MMMNDGLPLLERKSDAIVAEGLICPEIKADKDGTIEGYGSVFGNVDRGGDTVLPGAFAASLAMNPKIKMLWQHDPSDPIGVWDEIKEDEKGLWVKGRILKGIDRGRQALEMLREGVIDGLSIGYRTVKATRDADGNRVLQQLELWEVSVVTFPMDPKAIIDAVKAAAMSQRELERELLRDSKFSRSVVSALMRDGYKGVQALSDSGDEDYSELLEALQADSLMSSLS